ncbi:hypothetical protein PHMEG_0006482 [Phytophthora megakarya]|uniref:Uncharacterized protein n=1 Tax=Phytophthora megakarya TaxID=4795 RepID=A0A225WQE8_9STRA|nr:hypothetical protein PHMEG_0006482 [Phytophthora megakarya]
MIYSKNTFQRVLHAARDHHNWQDIAAETGVKVRTAYRCVATARVNDERHRLNPITLEMVLFLRQNNEYWSARTVDEAIEKANY